MPNLGDIFGQIIPGALLSAMGTPEQQRAAAEKARAEEEERRKFDLLRAIQREAMAEERRRTDLRYAPTTVNVPGVGEISGARDIVPALIQAAISRERDVSPEEAGVLSGYRERARAGPTGVVSRGGIPWSPGLEAEATKKAFPQLAGEVSPLTVDLPQVSVPRQSFERVMTEADQQRKEEEAERRKNLLGKSTARYRQLYSLARSQNIPHPIADALAIEKATQEFGIAPEREAFVPTPTERPEAKMSLEDEYLKAIQTPDATRTPTQKYIIEQYETQKRRREPAQTPFAAAVEIAGGDLAKALDLYRREEQRSQGAVERSAQFILEEARRQVTASLSNIERQIIKPEEYDARVRMRVQQLMRGKPPEVQEMVSSMAGLAPPKGGTVALPPGGEQLSRRDPRYKQLQDRKLTDQQIEAQFGVTLVP